MGEPGREAGRDPHTPSPRGRDPSPPPRAAGRVVGYGASWEELIPKQPSTTVPSAQQAAGDTACHGTESPWENWGAGEGQGGERWEGERAATALLSEAAFGEAVLAESSSNLTARGSLGEVPCAACRDPGQRAPGMPRLRQVGLDTQRCRVPQGLARTFCLLLLPPASAAPGTSQGLRAAGRAAAAPERTPGSDPTEVGEDGAAPWVSQLRSAPRCPEGPRQDAHPASHGHVPPACPALAVMPSASAAAVLMLPRHNRAGFGSGGQFQPPSALVLSAHCSASNKRNYSLCTRLPPPLPAPISRGWEGAGAGSALAQPIAPAALWVPWRARGGSGWDLPSSPACAQCARTCGDPSARAGNVQVPLAAVGCGCARYFHADVELGRAQACGVQGVGCSVQGGRPPAAPGAVPWQLLSFVAASG